MLECLLCGAELEIDDYWDETYSETQVTRSVTGHCPVCGKSHEWDEIYELLKIDRLVMR